MTTAKTTTDPTPAVAASPPAADITGAVASTKHALLRLTDARRFELIAVACLQEFEPSLRRTGGAGDEQRDGVAGPLLFDGDRVVLTVSLEKSWAPKIERDLAGLAEHGHEPELVIAVTNQATGADRRGELENDAKENRGYRLRVIDVEFLALRLLTPELLPMREDLLGLPAPQPPVAVASDEFARRQPHLGAPDTLFGRSAELDDLVGLLTRHVTVEVIGPGGVGKTRLVLEAARRIAADRVLFLDDRARVDADRLASDLGGADHLVLVVDNAHRQGDLGQILGLLRGRTGETGLILVARPGYDERLRQAIDGTPFAGPGAVARLTVANLSGKVIGEIVRAAEPKLDLEGAIERVIAVAQGNPLIALIAHQVAVDRGGLHGLAFTDLLGDYAKSAVATAVGSRTDVAADDLHDLLAAVAALGSIGKEDDEELLASLLGIPVRSLRHRVDDLADCGLLGASGDRLAVAPDLLAAHLLHEAHCAAGRRSGLRYREIWDAAGESRREAMCSALGGLQGFDVSAAVEVTTVVGDSLVEVAATNAERALALAQSAAAGLPEVAVRVIDAALDSLPTADAAREGLLLTAMEVLARVPEIHAGWPRQLRVAQAFFAAPTSDVGEKKIREGLGGVYKRLPVRTSEYDGYILASVQETLRDSTAECWEQHRGEPGAAETIAVAAGQLLTVTSEHSYMSPEIENQVKLSAGFLPGGERTQSVLVTGSRLLRETLGHLDARSQLERVKPLVELRRTAAGHTGAFGATPTPELVALAGDVLSQTADALVAERNLPLPTRSGLIDVLGSNPWAADEELAAFRALLVRDMSKPRSEEGATRAERAGGQAEALIGADDGLAELRRWQEWLSLARDAGMRHHAHATLGDTLAVAVEREPERIGDALIEVVSEGGDLCDFAAGALGSLLVRPGGDQVAARLASGTPKTRVALAGALAWTAESWADELLDELASDPEESVRSGAAHAAGWTEGASPRRLHIGLRACLPDHLEAALSLLGGVERSSGDERPLNLDAEAHTLVDSIVTSAACRPQLEGYYLIEVAELVGRPRLVVEACLARLRWLEAEPAADFRERMARESLPDELAPVARAGAEDSDRVYLLDLLEKSDDASEARSCATDLLAWIDDNSGLVTMRLGQWFECDDERLHYLASQLLRSTRDREAFKERARALLAGELYGVIKEAILGVREPTWFVGSEKKLYNEIADELAAWIDDGDERLSAVGRAGAERFRALAEDADDEFADDDEPEWG